MGLASVLLVIGLTFAGSQVASADTIATSTEAQTTETTNKDDAVTQTENQGLTKESATESLNDAKAAQDKIQGEVTEATKNVEDGLYNI
ncbi:hypothetical protein IBB3154_1222 [Ligilactobacillus salivarius]|uniref:hypothetical protein n=1 Tax=Ligilactobacillus salivarius TaxID=1624 RepID=UPI0013E1FA66|nr:hypothetical protein [Ligilactobacillus salivarius]QIG36707.1 hypothetical protein IBB3154_1222 [Ligilactobacillus salivarius]